ncbi:peptide chain release factor N(5)-glutamine methyltransferase [Acinetobacter variabilis]|uniref:peptide chain release factor N(5)-glutamine methyltransferase n=1 Tax=Acinetobacter variabilis TaxID=70346 RepID=UPI000F68179E|nr:peptide chain release factor N(5)-glutamine methyltransferase [Acinetobacter variabilis]MCU4311341.1 peptide chain release factor N(5)-glutamine methyltransferase [Acinetobacter variabilis]MCU4628390.1 peptide chain release factor N(5)-glutamine methyltransferase [Acinetobacter variabilis]QXR20530.1 peptide chain release factor N(5)-glutamine methyltransferase [Acinetobacter variabilis]
MNIQEALALRGEPESYERQENAWLLEHITKIDAFDLVMKKDQQLTPEQEQAYVESLARIAAGEPLAYVTGSQPFWTLDLKVTKDTLVPRPDTEVLVETVLKLDLPEDARIVDLGTGTGAIALSLASERPNWSVTATDIYEPTLEVAKYNAEQHDLDQVQFILGSWLKPFGRQFFDAIVSNPPYIDADDEHMPDLATEPERALVSDKNGLADIEIIIQQAKKHLTVNGWVVLEHGYDQGDVVRHLFTQAGYKQVRTVKDYGGNDRVTLGQWPR